MIDRSIIKQTGKYRGRRKEGRREEEGGERKERGYTTSTIKKKTNMKNKKGKGRGEERKDRIER